MLSGKVGYNYIEKPVLFLDLSCWRVANHILISPILSIIESAFQGGGWNLTPPLVLLRFPPSTGYQTLQPAVGWWWPTQPSDHWFWWGGVMGVMGLGWKSSFCWLGSWWANEKREFQGCFFFFREKKRSQQLAIVRIHNCCFWICCLVW